MVRVVRRRLLEDYKFWVGSSLRSDYLCFSEILRTKSINPGKFGVSLFYYTYQHYMTGEETIGLHVISALHRLG